MNKKKVFRSRISVLLIVFILSILAMTLIPISHYGEYYNIFIFGGVFLSIILPFFGMRYIISGNKIFIKTLWIIPSGSIDISKITAVKRSYNPLSSPAASLKRLHIVIYRKSWLISPVREQEFIKALEEINPNIYVNVPYKKGIWRIQDWDI